MKTARIRRAVDLAWIVAGALMLVLYTLQVARWVLNGGVGRASPVDWVLAIVGVVVAYWIVVGCWRRTSWLRRRYEARMARES